MTSQPEPIGGSLEPVPVAPASRLGALLGPLRIASRIESLEALERLLCVVAVHPEGGGFEAATLLRRVPGLDLLEPAHREVRGAWSASLEATLDAALASPAGDPGVGGIGFTAEDLEGAAEEAWTGGTPVIGPGGAAPMPWHGAGTIGAAALRREGEPWALLVVERRAGMAEEHHAALEGLVALAAELQAGVARREESRLRGRQMAALAELSRAGVSTMNLAELLRLGTRLAMSGSGARGAATWLDVGGRTRLEAVEGPAGWRERIACGVGPLVREVIESGCARCIVPALDEPALAPEIAAEIGGIVLVPLVAYGRVHGATAVFLAGTTAGPGRDPLGFLCSIGDRIALAVDQARRFEAAGQLERRVRELGAQVRREERRAAAGDLAIRAGAAARNPLASIGAFARRLERELGPSFPRRDYLEIILRETERLERLLAETSRVELPETPALRVERLNDVVQEALQRLGESLVRRRVRLLKRLAPDLPPLLLDPARVRRAVENVLAHVVDVLPAGGRVRVESRRAGAAVVLEIAHDGAHSPGDALESLFVPFAAGPAGGPGLGLAVAHRIVQEHGGEIRVRSEGEWSTVFAITFPVRENQDRRKMLAGRRRGHPDRRARAGS